MAGGDLARRIAGAPGGRLAIDDAVAIAIQLCRALEHAHARGVIHRDLKPGNVWLASDGIAKLGDFGLALALDRSRLTAAGMIVGTVAYMPPEQASVVRRDARSDLYALGATLYEMRPAGRRSWATTSSRCCRSTSTRRRWRRAGSMRRCRNRSSG